MHLLLLPTGRVFILSGSLAVTRLRMSSPGLAHPHVGQPYEGGTPKYLWSPTTSWPWLALAGGGFPVFGQQGDWDEDDAYLDILGDKNNEGDEDAMLPTAQHSSEVDMHYLCKQVVNRLAIELNTLLDDKEEERVLLWCWPLCVGCFQRMKFRLGLPWYPGSLQTEWGTS